MTYTVSAVNKYIDRLLRGDPNLQNIEMSGEISQIGYGGGHCYLTLSDAECSINCNIWRSNLEKIDASILEVGKRLVVKGYINAYPPRGTYSFIVVSAQAYGMGELMAEFLRIKKLLGAEGLFDEEHKKALPSFPKRVGVVTAQSGAAIEDIKKTILKKNDYTDILIFPTTVQGVSAVGSIIDNIKLANEVSKNDKKIDLLIVGRGGGSPEDLAAFNDEGVARAIFASDIPVISAVGHESDFSISDLVADYRAATPTAAAEAAVMDTGELRMIIAESKITLKNALQSKLESEKSIVINSINAMRQNMQNKLREFKLMIQNSVTMLEQNDPMNILSKGYAAVLGDGGSVISDIDDINIDNEYIVKLSNGSFTAKVVSKDKR